MPESRYPLGMDASERIEAATARLCPDCGLCCNGVLYSSVRLQSEDNPAHLELLGLALQPEDSGRSFSQPCVMHDGSLCRIYPERPARCRQFRCRVLEDVIAGAIPPLQAQRAIRSAREQSARVRALLRQFGDHDESKPLSRRCQPFLDHIVNPGNAPDFVKLRGELLLAVHQLTQTLKSSFYPGGNGSL